MEMLLMFSAGLLIGVWITASVWHRKIIGTLKIAQDEYDDSNYLYIELDRPYFPKHKYVAMRVDRSRK